MMMTDENCDTESQLTQLFKLYEERFSALESAVQEISDTIGRITNGVNGVIDEHRKSIYGAKLGARSSDFEPYKEFYGALSNGSDIIQDLIDNMLQNKIDENGIDEYVNEALNTFKGRFGKIIGIKDEDQAEGEPLAQESIEEAKPEMEVSIETKGEPKGDTVGSFIEQLTKARKMGL